MISGTQGSCTWALQSLLLAGDCWGHRITSGGGGGGGGVTVETYAAGFAYKPGSPDCLNLPLPFNRDDYSIHEDLQTHQKAHQL